jgi:hypothetical protein
MLVILFVKWAVKNPGTHIHLLFYFLFILLKMNPTSIKTILVIKSSVTIPWSVSKSKGLSYSISKMIYNGNEIKNKANPKAIIFL